ncbi:GNAT family N-acetyltransferase [Stutzerimonas xanthomarina]|uniref:GNAT family N-acetyltransferase n=1 Tax=Stutzerimonas xanthomarina TaxID=271420 RepID=UPI003AA8076D
MPKLIKPADNRAALNPAFGLRPLCLDEDVAIIQPWYQMDYAHFWNMQNMSIEATIDFYRDAATHGLQAYLGYYDDSPAFVLECYDPRRDLLGDCYPVQPGDIGMHFFVGPSQRPIRHYTRDVLRTVMAFLFDALAAQRVVVEPDLRNERVHRLNRLVGFVDAGTMALPGKTARLAFCSPHDFAQSLEEQAP